MRKRTVYTTGKIKRNTSRVGMTIEEMLRMANENESIDLNGKGLIYTDRKDGVIADYNIRADKWDIAMMELNVGANVGLEGREALSAEEPQSTAGTESKD